jgi:predicted DNA-binding ribbon-helix-helix protein
MAPPSGARRSRAVGILATSGESVMKSSVVKRSIVINGHKTSVSLEDAFWKGLKEIAQAEHSTLSDEVAIIDGARAHGNLSSAIRLFVLDRVRSDCLKRQEAAVAKPMPVAAAMPRADSVMGK